MTATTVLGFVVSASSSADYTARSHEGGYGGDDGGLRGRDGHAHRGVALAVALERPDARAFEQ